MTVQVLEDRADQFFYFPDRMLFGNPALDIQQGDQAGLGSVASSHSMKNC
jgi:hypothetical protein